MKSDTCINKLQVVKDIAENIVVNRKKHGDKYDLNIAHRELAILLSFIKTIDKDRLSMFIESNNDIAVLFARLGTIAECVKGIRISDEERAELSVYKDSFYQIVDLFNCSNSDEDLFQYLRHGKQYVIALFVFGITNFLTAEFESHNGSFTEKEICIYIISALYNLAGIIFDAHCVKQGIEVPENGQKLAVVCCS